jgi:hypothetical protein
MEFAGTKRRAIQLKLTISSDRSAARSQAPASTSSRRASNSPRSRPLGSTVGGVLLAAAGRGAGAPPTSRRESWAAGAPPPPPSGLSATPGGMATWDTAAESGGAEESRAEEQSWRNPKATRRRSWGREGGAGGGWGRGLGLEQAYIRRGVRLNAFWPSDPIRRPVEEAHLFEPFNQLGRHWLCFIPALLSIFSFYAPLWSSTHK